MFSVHQHWDPLTNCLVGISYPPEVYDYIKNDKVRRVFYRIAEETEEDYQKLISLLKSFNVDIIRPDITETIEQAKYDAKQGNEICGPGGFMQPRDRSIMIGNKFYLENKPWYRNVKSYVESQGNTVVDNTAETGMYTAPNEDKTIMLCGAYVTRLGKDLYIGTWDEFPDNHPKLTEMQNKFESMFPEYRIHVVGTEGHADGSFCPVTDGLIISLQHVKNYEKTFPNWEIVRLVGEGWSKVGSFLRLKEKNRGKWWVPGEELNDEFTDFVETWMNRWVGYVEESVFDVNMLIINPTNVVVNGYNKLVWDALESRGITAHICNFRHRYFWDGGLHCITSDLNRIGSMKDFNITNV